MRLEIGENRLDFGASTGSDRSSGSNRPESVADYVRRYKLLEDAGFTHVWISDPVRMSKDTYILMTLCALNTEKVKIGTSIINPYTRHPMVAANAWMTFDEISHGRAIIGLGIGETLVTEMGFRPATVKVCKDAVQVFRSLIAGETVNYKSEWFTLRNAKLRFGYPRKIPIYVAASGPKMLQAAGEVGDGIIVCNGIHPRILEFALKKIREGAEQAGRDLSEIYLISHGGACVSEDGQEAREAVKTWVAHVIGSYDPILAKLAGVSDEDILRLRAAFDPAYHIDAATGAYKLVTDEMVRKFAVAGTPEDIIREINVIERFGFNQTSFLFMGQDKAKQINLYKEHVLPQFK